MKKVKILLAAAAAVMMFSSVEKAKAASDTETNVPIDVTFVGPISITLANSGLSFGTIVNAGVAGTADLIPTPATQTLVNNVTGAGNAAVVASGATAARFTIQNSVFNVDYGVTLPGPTALGGGLCVGTVNVTGFNLYSVNANAGTPHVNGLGVDTLWVGGTVDWTNTASGTCTGAFDVSVNYP